MTRNDALVPCIGCGALYAAFERRHPYVGASESCWRAYGRAIARVRRLTGEDAKLTQRLLLDAYAVAHPGQRGDIGAQSVGVHLVGLAVVLERGGSPEEAADAIVLAVRTAATFEWLEPPAADAVAEAWSAVDVSLTGDDDGVARAVERWARAVWEAWRPHHSAVRRRVDALLRQRAAS